MSTGLTEYIENTQAEIVTELSTNDVVQDIGSRFVLQYHVLKVLIDYGNGFYRKMVLKKDVAMRCAISPA